MSHWDAVRRVTVWEFWRFLKVRDLIMSVVIFAVIGGAAPFVIDLITSSGDVELAAVGAPFDLPEDETFSFVAMTAQEAAAAFEAGELDGVLTFHSTYDFTLQVERQRNWVGQLDAYLTQLVLPARLAESSLTPQEYQQLLQPANLEVAITGESGDRGALAVNIVLGVMIFGVFTGTGLLFTAITGEKTQRVTEQVISAVTPQAWIDGKVLGTMLYTIANIASLALGVGIAIVASGLFQGLSLSTFPSISIDPFVLLTTLAFAILGAALFYFLFAAIAATIDDPNTSQRSGIIMLPGVFVGLGWLGLIGNSENLFYMFLSYFPFTAVSAMPVRVLFGEAGPIEVLLSLALLLATVLLARRVAGKIFSLAILITGKEPSWGEMAAWVRRAR